jgi:DNA ligase-1
MAIKTWPTLYKKNSNGSTQEWTISIDVDQNGVFIQKRFGQVGGKIQESTPDYIEGKNIGKANETTPAAQAESEAQAQWVKKQSGSKGYTPSQDDAAAGVVSELVQGGIVPMLAHKHSTVTRLVDGTIETILEQAAKIKFPCYVQPKLDGIRSNAMYIGSGPTTMWSRERKPQVSMPHIIAAVDDMLGIYSFGVTLDGELYNHDYHDKFEEITSLVRPEYVKDDHWKVQYHIYDVAMPNKTFAQRLEFLRALPWPTSTGDRPAPLVLVETRVANNQDELMEIFWEFLGKNYEGAIVRNADSQYENKRSYNLQKIKAFFDDDFEIVEIKAGKKGKMQDKAMFVCKITGDEDPRAKAGTFDVKLKGELSRLAEILENPDEFIGKKMTVRYQNWTAYGKPRMPVGVAIRDYE